MATLAAAGLPIVGVVVLARFGTALAAWVEATPAWGVALVILLAGALLCGVALLPTHAVSLASGYALGPIAGTLVALATVTIGSVVGAVGGRLFAGTGLAGRLAEDPKWHAAYAALVRASRRRTALLVALVRLSPAVPFAATNVALAALRVPAGPYLAGTILGLAPRVAAVALAGAGLAELDWSRPGAAWLLAAGGAATVLALVIVGRVAAAAMRRAGGQPAGAASGRRASSDVTS